MNEISNLPDGYVQLLNYGAFNVRFFVSFNLNGQTHVNSSGSFPVLNSRKIIVPANGTNVEVLVQLDMFINTWITLFHKIYPKSDQICLLSWGVTLFSYCKEVPCTAPGSDGSNPNIPSYPCCCNCCCCRCCK